ncbi:MAG: hypothetical protein JWL99_86, partial [Streptomyces oryziradicis]|nr:hypothetical protein [Actinacidiphila oryziradicis]
MRANWRGPGPHEPPRAQTAEGAEATPDAVPALADSIAGLLALCATIAPYHRERTGAGRRTRAAGYAEALGARWNSLCPPPTGSEFAGA